MNNLKVYVLGLLCLLNVSMQNAYSFNGHYGCWWQIHELDESKTDEVSLKRQSDFESIELKQFISSLRGKLGDLVFENIELPFLLFKTGSEYDDYQLMHIDIDLIMEEDPEPGALHAFKKYGLEVVIDDNDLQEQDHAFVQFVASVEIILDEACDELEQLLKKYEDVLLFRANQPALTLRIAFTLDQDMIDSIEAAGFIQRIE